MIYLNCNLVISFEKVQVVPYDLINTILAFFLLSVACFQKSLVIPGSFTVLMLHKELAYILHVNCFTGRTQVTTIKNITKRHRNLRFVTLGLLARKLRWIYSKNSYKRKHISKNNSDLKWS